MARINAGAAHRATDHPRIEALLARYPALSAAELAELLHWFERQASALDVAVVASNERIREGYDRFNAEHIDRFGPRDVIRAAVFVALVGILALGVVWSAP